RRIPREQIGVGGAERRHARSLRAGLGVLTALAAPSSAAYVARMHTVDPTTEQMIRSVLAYAENRLRLDPVPLDESSRDPAELDAALKGLLGNEPHNSDQVLGVYTSVMAPAVISADSPRYLG